MTIELTETELRRLLILVAFTIQVAQARDDSPILDMAIEVGNAVGKAYPGWVPYERQWERFLDLADRVGKAYPGWVPYEQGVK